VCICVQDWDGLYRVAGIKSFMAVPIGGAGEVLGLLTIAKHEPGAFNDEWCVTGNQQGRGAVAHTGIQQQSHLRG
jgi:hypothetical protein